MVQGTVQVRRVYDQPERSDGTRVLVDRVWPRGMTEARAAIDDWCKDVAPSLNCANGTVTTPPDSATSAADTGRS